MSTKTNKAMLSRVRKTKSGSIMVSGKGRGHFNAKHPRSKKMSQKRQRGITLSQKTKQHYLLA